MKTLWPALFFGALALLFPAVYGPTLVADLIARSDPPHTMPEAPIGKVQCRTFLFAVSLCKVSVAEGGRGERAFHYAMSGLVRQEKLAVIGSHTAPAYLTTSLGRNHLLNRTLTFAAWMAILLSLTFGAVRYHAYHRRRTGRA